MERTLWPCLALLCTACSLVVDFPESKLRRDAGPDATQPTRDATADSARDTGASKDAQPNTGCSMGSNMGCDDSQLCCDRQDGNGAVCIDTSGASDCSACNVGCADPKAPNCGARACECEAGTGKGCSDGKTCAGSGSSARCVECMVDADCAVRTDNLKQCVSNQCVECDRGALASDPSDDQGCTPAVPICNDKNQCTGCSTSPDNCPTGMQCNPDQGCLGCRLNVPISQNGCGGTSPVCASVTVDGVQAAQCRKCQADTECSGGYCVEASGECVTGCDPDEPPGMNACAAVTPICAQGAAGYACTTCKVPADCAALTDRPLCSTSGTLAGQCVACRNNTDCSATGAGAAPVCGLNGTCRARTADDCKSTANTKAFDPTTMTCVACITATDCIGNSNGPLCTSKHTCGRCLDDSGCSSMPATPVCNPMTNQCAAGCTSDTQCMVNAKAPRCDQTSGVCVECTMLTMSTDCAPTTPICSPTTKSCVQCTQETSGDNLCAVRGTQLGMPSPACVSSSMANPLYGQCSACDLRGMQNFGCSGLVPYCISTTSSSNKTTNSCVTCVNTSPTSAPDEGCLTTTLTQCVQTAVGSPPSCNTCDPQQAPGAQGCPTGTVCTSPSTCVAMTTTP